MKKIIVVIAVAMLAVVANAASFKWTAGNIYGSDGATKFDGMVTIMAYTTDLSSAVKVTDAYAVAGVLKSDAAGTATGFTYNWEAAVVDTSYNFYLVFEDDGKVFDSSVSSPAKILSAVAQATSTPTVAFANMAAATQNASNWQGGSVPEPTTGLLVLLGMAGLALKRKVA